MNICKKYLFLSYRHSQSAKWKKGCNEDDSPLVNQAGADYTYIEENLAHMFDQLEEMQNPTSRKKQEQEDIAMQTLKQTINTLFEFPDTVTAVSDEIQENPYLLENKKRYVGGNKHYTKALNANHSLLAHKKQLYSAGAVEEDEETNNQTQEDENRSINNLNNSLTIATVADNDENGLNEKQNAALKLICQAFNKMRLLNDAAGALFLIHGPPGTGKSYVANAFIKRLNDIELTCLVSAPTGVAASVLNGGRTVHSLFGLDNRNRKKNSISSSLSGGKLLALKNLIGDSACLLIDEVSFVSAKMLSEVDTKLREIKSSQLPFGGLMVILSGDMFQLPPVRELSLYSAVLKPKHSLNEIESNGVNLFKSFQLIPLEEQMRLKTAETESARQHLQYLEQIRTNHDQPFSKEFLQSIKTLTKLDVSNDKNWRYATIAVITNKERNTIKPPC